MYRVSTVTFLVILSVFILLDMTYPGAFFVGGSKPGLIIIMVIFMGLFCGIETGIAAGLAAGFAKDVFSTGYFGADIIIFSALGLICGILAEKIDKENILVQMAACFTASYVISGLNFKNAVFTALAAPLIIAVLRMYFIFRNKLLYI